MGKKSNICEECNEYAPDYASPPSETLAEMLAASAMPGSALFWLNRMQNYERYTEALEDELEALRKVVQAFWDTMVFEFDEEHDKLSIVLGRESYAWIKGKESEAARALMQYLKDKEVTA